MEETNLLTVPMYHVAGLQAALAAVFGGRTLVVMPQFDAEGWMRLAAEHRADRAMLVPTMLKMVMDHPGFGNFDLSSLKVITYGAAPMPLPVVRASHREVSRHEVHQCLRADGNGVHHHHAAAGRPRPHRVGGGG